MTDQPAASPTQEEPASPEAVPPLEKKGGAGKVIVAIAGVLAVMVIAAVTVIAVRNVLSATDPTHDAKAGDCLANLPQTVTKGETSVKDVKVVACDAADARYAVVGRVDDVTAVEASGDEVCEAFAGTTMRFYAIPAGGKGYVLCLKPA